MKKVCLSGQCRSGYDGRRKYVVHLVANEGFGESLCGRVPSRLSAIGWVELHDASAKVTCIKCLKRKSVILKELEGVV